MASQPPVLLVAGPSGAGKSTLIDQLSGGHLPAEIQRELPEGAATWPLLQGKQLRKIGRSQVGALPGHLNGGIVAHYDTTYIMRAKLDHYEQDHAAELFRPVASLVILYIRIDIDRLQAQLAGRVASRLNSRSRPHGLWVRLVREPLKHALSRLTGADTPGEVQDIYRNRRQLEYYSNEWDRYMRSLIEGKPHARILCVEPMLKHDGGPSFRLVEKVVG